MEKNLKVKKLIKELVKEKKCMKITPLFIIFFFRSISLKIIRIRSRHEGNFRMRIRYAPLQLQIRDKIDFRLIFFYLILGIDTSRRQGERFGIDFLMGINSGQTSWARVAKIAGRLTTMCAESCLPSIHTPSVLRLAPESTPSQGEDIIRQNRQWSGAVESGVKNVVNIRMKGCGMRWNIDRADRLLFVRARYLSGEIPNTPSIEKAA